MLVDIPKDMQLTKTPYSYTPWSSSRGIKVKPTLRIEQVQQAANLINEACRPMMLVGQGVTLSGAEKELLMLAEATGIPVAQTLLGLSAFPADHPLYVGMLGMHGNYGPNLLTNESDLLVAVGMRFDDRVTGDLSRYAKNAKIVHIDIDEAEIGKNVPVDVALAADAREALEALCSCVARRDHAQWVSRFKACMATEQQEVIASQLHPQKGITMGMVIHEIAQKTRGEAVLVTDVGQHQMVASRYYAFKRHRSMVTSGGLGTMGFGLPASMGAALGAPSRTTVAVIGDGGLQMKIQELGTISNENIPVKIVLLNNSFLGMVRQWQELFFDKRYSFVEMSNPDFGLIVRGYGIPYEQVTKPEVLQVAVERMLNHSGPYFLEVAVEREDNVFPMVPAGCAVNEIRLK